MPSMFRLLFWVLLLPFRLLRWAVIRIYLAVWGYDWLRLDIHGSLPDRHGPGGLLAALSAERRGPALLDVLRALDRAARDPRVRAVLIELGPLRCGLARAEEVRRALRRVREADKAVVVYLEEAGLAEYSLALGASRIVLAPAGGLNLVGVSSEVVFLKGLLDKVGIRAWLSARGKYKTARELFAEPGMTEANREMTEALVGDLYEQLVQALAESRGQEPEAVRRVLDEGPFLPEAALGAGLVDDLGYREDAEAAVESAVPHNRPVELDAYLSLSTSVAGRGRPALVAWLDVAGHIKGGYSVPGADGPRATGSRSFVKEVERIRKESRIKAVLVRVDSPGGSALASDVMWRALCRLREDKPVVVSMAGVAASGGYYVSGLPETPIVALDATITGSIGVLAGKFDARALYDKLGIVKETIARGKRATLFSDYRGFTPDELEKLDHDLDVHYRDFVQKMAAGRGRSPEEVDAVAQGRVWTGRQGSERGLVDRTGGLLDAFDQLRESLSLPAGARLALARSASERRRIPVRLEWNLPEALSRALSLPLALAELYPKERLFALLPFDIDVR